jgi:hypothetical protein
MPSFKRYRGNIGRVLLTLGVILLIVTALGVGADLLRRHDTESAPDGGQIGVVPLTLSTVYTALPVLGALVTVPLLASRLLHRLYDTSLEKAHNALNRLVFGQLGHRPYVLVKEGEIVAGGDSFAGHAGGPATLIIYNDTAVVTEQYGRIKRILGPGIQRVERFEKAWEMVDLRPQQWVYEVFALTKEGIPVSCEADITFQINDQPQAPEAQVRTEGPYPYAEDAVFLAAASKWIREPEREDNVVTWAGRVVIGMTEGLLRNVIAEYRLDWLIAPPQPDQKHPREEIRERLEEGLRESVRNVGAKLLDVKIGAIEVKARDEEVSRQISDVVSTQRIEAWYADWEARALETKAEGEAELLQMDMARIQAQAEMVVTLIEALQSTMMRQGAIEPYVLAMRFVEALRWMSYNTISREFMPPEALRTLRRLQQLLESEAGMPGDDEGIRLVRLGARPPQEGV